MSAYEKLDGRIIVAIKQNSSPLYNRDVNIEADRIAAATGRDSMRVIDGRIQALRKAGKIKHYRKSEMPDGVSGWGVIERKPE